MDHTKRFDFQGHHRHLDHDKWIAELEEQLRKHVWSCIDCLRVEAGLNEKTRCFPRSSILKRIDIIKQAQQRGEGEGT